MSQEVDMKKYEWGGMLSIWGQGDKAHQGVCYSGLAYSPKDYIDVIEKDGPPVEKWMLRYVDLKLANDWLAYCINHVFPEEVLKHITFTRAFKKGGWPSRYEYKLSEDDIVELWNEEDEEQHARLHALQKKEYGGCRPWLRVSFSQELPPNVMFAVGVILRYASEYGVTLKLIDLLPQLQPNIQPKDRLAVAMNLGGARGHAISGWGYGYLSKFRKVVEAYYWKEGFMSMMKMAPFWKDPHKRGQVDEWFGPTWKQKPGDMQITANSYSLSFVKRNGLSLYLKHAHANEVLNLWDEEKA